jgi:hypothetical protein
MITLGEVREFGTHFFDAVAGGASAAEQAQFFLDPHARIYIAWNGATISLKQHETLHAQWIDEHHSFGHFDLTELNASPRKSAKPAVPVFTWSMEPACEPPPAATPPGVRLACDQWVVVALSDCQACWMSWAAQRAGH